jgi:hypothetical protein
MTHYVGAIRVMGRPRHRDGRVPCRGCQMDNARGVHFLATPEALATYFGDEDEDRCIEVPDQDVTWLARRDGGRSMWSCAGLT